jgi:hypothetical protein
MKRDMGAVATNPAIAPWKSLRYIKPESEASGTARIAALLNYTGLMAASQGGKRLFPLRESPTNWYNPGVRNQQEQMNDR